MNRYEKNHYGGGRYENLFRGHGSSQSAYRPQKYDDDINEDDEHHFEEGSSGWRLSDRLYELSLEAEEQEKKQKRAISARVEALHEMKRENARLRAQLEDARDQAAAATEIAASARDDARDREDDLAMEVVVLRAALAKRMLGENIGDLQKNNIIEDADVESEDTEDEDFIVYDRGDRSKKDNMYCLDTLAANGKEEIVREFLSGVTGERASRIRKRYYKILGRALLNAANSGQVEICKLLIRRGALRSTPFVRGTNGYTALHYAAAAGAVEIIEALCATEAYAPQSLQTNDPLDLGDCQGKTALMIAAQEQQWSAARTLLRLGADAELRTPEAQGGKKARDLVSSIHGDENNIMDSISERFWNASAAGNRAWRRKHFGSALFHFSSALVLAEQMDNEENNNDESAAPSGVDLARLELNCAKAALRLGRASEAEQRASKALDRHRQATRGGIYANALSVRAECRENLYDFENAASDFDELARLAAPADTKSWSERARTARDHRDASHYAILGVSTRADDAELRRAYKRASMRWHPDRRRNTITDKEKQNEDPSDDAARAERQFRRINEAKEILLDSYKRAVYDVEQRRRLAFEADKLPISGVESAQNNTWPWHAATTNNNSAASIKSTQSNKENYGLTSVRYAVPWKNKSSKEKPSSRDNSETRRFAGLTKQSERVPPPPPSVPPQLNELQKKDDEQSIMPPPAPPREDAIPKKEIIHTKDGEYEWSSRLRRYEDELKRQREELDRAKEVRQKVAREREQLAKSRGTFFAPREDDPITEHSEDDDDDTHLDDDSPLDDDEEEEDNDTIEEGEEDDLSAQLRDASEWFDQFDIHGKGELDMTFFDELIDHLGLRDVLGDEEIQRQRFFADPTGSGNLKRGSFLGWFAALLEGSAKAGMHHRRARPPPPSRSSFAYHHDFAWKNGSPHHNGTVPTPPVPPTTAASN
mmetsp:Transcript_262/g.356  ORF Transcript_262/g.356 Transcript_262/m.356 type:complete len:944 (-) Transcript_262:236-3067(-)|eukprot:CAMPEP_0197289392 /NCGR_PEP_ID=MMETSP0890-20130614/6634_1 /TAXON_ID=44058 ORGANISM="Aureoumbra lagunensis, Strain CCMP1510" /NCGR_SAMPLE_ID=MMETSP0890 /ASSEMBLY_ACC=CAM_ASM_000533 /LENGTH=943 /DNA_ID=CAMNT_0042760767 /DNA_START=130 /DNA_END=2961 /DNA_ORIENTATION=+